MSGSKKLAQLMKTYLIDDNNPTESQATTKSVIELLERPGLHDVFEAYKTLDQTDEPITPDQILSLRLSEQDPLKLDLGVQDLTDDDLIEFVIPFLRQHPEIKTVVLGNNQLTDKGAIALLTSITTIENLGLDDNRARNEDGTFTYLSPATAKVAAAQKNLLALELSYSHIGDEGFAAFQHNTTLRELWVRGCDITNIGALEAAKNVGLTKLHVDENVKLGNKGAIALGNIKTLREFSATFCKLRDKSASALLKHKDLELDVVRSSIGRYNLFGEKTVAAITQHNSDVKEKLKLFTPVKDAASSTQNTSTASVAIPENEGLRKGTISQ